MLCTPCFNGRKISEIICMLFALWKTVVDIIQGYLPLHNILGEDLLIINHSNLDGLLCLKIFLSLLLLNVRLANEYKQYTGLFLHLFCVFIYIICIVKECIAVENASQFLLRNSSVFLPFFPGNGS